MSRYAARCGPALTGSSRRCRITSADGAARQQELSAEIAAAVQAMQFQDRVSQQVTHIVEALESMQTAIAAPLGLVEASRAGRAAAIDLLSKSYTMAGERADGRCFT